MRHDIDTEIKTETELETQTSPNKRDQHGGLILALGCGGLLILTIVLNVSC